jgi:hypothetical protein
MREGLDRNGEEFFLCKSSVDFLLLFPPGSSWSGFKNLMGTKKSAPVIPWNFVKFDKN